MKLLTELPSNTIEDMYLNICLRSKSGCNIKVGDKRYNVYTNNSGEYVVTEFKLDFEMSEEEFKKYIKW